jgi:glutamate synthase domain-containing protein 3
MANDLLAAKAFRREIASTPRPLSHLGPQDNMIVGNTAFTAIAAWNISGRAGERFCISNPVCTRTWKALRSRVPNT